MSVCASTFRAKGSVSGSRIQQRDSCSAALPKPASWRYRQTAGLSVRATAHRGRCGEGTEIVHHIAAEQRHDILSGDGTQCGVGVLGLRGRRGVRRAAMGCVQCEGELAAPLLLGSQATLDMIYKCVREPCSQPITCRAPLAAFTHPQTHRLNACRPSDSTRRDSQRRRPHRRQATAPAVRTCFCPPGLLPLRPCYACSLPWRASTSRR
jgi:hypothetical protein